MNSPAFHFNKNLRQARHLMRLGNHAEALGVYARLVKQFPQGGLWGEYGRAAAISGDFDLAEQVWETIRAREPNTADLLARLGWEYQNIRLHAKARELYRQAAAVEPANREAQLSLAWLLARTNSVDEARGAVARCLELDVQDEQARYLSAHLDRRENKFAEAERQFRELLAAVPRHPYVGYACHAELAHVLDRTERFEEAMAQLEEGKKLARRNSETGADGKTIDQWHENVLRQAKSLPKNILAVWGRSFPPRTRAPAPPMAFLTGSARSGSTLLERILDAHPAVAACDESLAFPRIQPLIDITARSIPAQRLNILRQRYTKNFTRALGPSAAGKTLLDKNPSQTAFLPAFLRAFPELRALIALRDPRDVIVSLYFQNQSGTNCLTLEQLAQHYGSVMEMWLIVREWEGLAWTETRYEDIVADLRKEGSRVTKFLGLEWHENQTRFYESNREKPVMSTNYNDVTQPVYTRSVGRWRIYEKHLAPILLALEPYCRRFGYA